MAIRIPFHCIWTSSTCLRQIPFLWKGKAPLPGAEHSSACSTLAGGAVTLEPGLCPCPGHKGHICMWQASDHQEDDFLTNSGRPELRNEGGKKMGNRERGTERIRSGEVEVRKRECKNDKMPVLINRKQLSPLSTCPLPTLNLHPPIFKSSLLLVRINLDFWTWTMQALAKGKVLFSVKELAFYSGSPQI